MAKLQIESLAFGLIYLADDHTFRFIPKLMEAEGVVQYSQSATNIKLTLMVQPIKFFCFQFLNKAAPEIIFLTTEGALYSLSLSLEKLLINQPFQCDKIILPNNVDKVNDFVCGGQVGFIAFIDDLGKVYTCGDNAYGQLGIGTNLPKHITHWQQAKLPPNIKAEKLINTTGSALGIVDSDNKMWLCGDCRIGQLGIGWLHLRDQEYIPKLRAPSSFDGTPAIAHALTGCTMILDEQGEFYSSGYYTLSIPYRESRKFSKIKLLPLGKKAASMVCSDFTILIVDEEGLLWYGDGVIRQPIRAVDSIRGVTALYLKDNICLFATQAQEYWICQKVVDATGRGYFNFERRQQLHACSSVSMLVGPRANIQGKLNLSREIPKDDAVFARTAIGNEQL